MIDQNESQSQIAAQPNLDQTQRDQYKEQQKLDISQLSTLINRINLNNKPIQQ